MLAKAVSFSSGRQTSIHDSPDLSTAGAAICSGPEGLTDGFDAVTATTYRGNDLIYAHAEARAHSGAGIRLVRTGPTGHEPKAFSQVYMLGLKLRSCPVAGDGNGFAPQEEGREKPVSIEEGKPDIAGVRVRVAQRVDAAGDSEDAAAPVLPRFRRRLERQLQPPTAISFGEGPIVSILCSGFGMRYGEGIALSLEAADCDTHILRGWLAGKPVGDCGHHCIDAGLCGELIIPMHRREHEVSIETQVELGKEMVAQRGWNLIDIFEDRAISGTSYKLRRGIQALLRRVAQGDIDIVLCVTVDRLSRDMEHSARILKELRYRDADIWTVHAGAPITDLEMALRAALSHELVEQIRYRTREGMKTTVRKGRSAGGLAYGYRTRLEYDAAGERIRGLRDIDEAEAKIIVWIFEQYASGRTPLQIAVDLNSRSIPGPRGAKWRDTAIRGHRRRGTGILNNEAYIGRVVWNRREYRKHPDSEKRLARHNDQDQWVVAEQPRLRIVSDDLWAAVKRRQAEVDQAFAKTNTNKLARSHRPQYLLSGRLECGHCLGPYAIMAKDRYGCTNR
nr:recombinase family protein [Rhizobium sp. Khangiran2]